MAEGWAKIDWAPSGADAAITHTRLNNIGHSQRTIGYGETPGTVTVNANQNHIANLGNLTFATGGRIVQDAWTNATLQNGWVDFGFGQTPKYVKDKQGFVHLFGVARSGTTTDGTIICTLPVGYRPTVDAITVTYHDGGACRLTIDPNGNVKIQGVTSNAYLALSGVYFPTF